MARCVQRLPSSPPTDPPGQRQETLCTLTHTDTFQSQERRHYERLILQPEPEPTSLSHVEGLSVNDVTEQGK